MKIVLASSVALASLLAFMPPSYSLDVNGLLRGYLGMTNPNNPNEQNIVRQNFDTRISQLNDQVAAGVTSGQLTPAEESELRADLTRITGLENSYLSDGKLDNFETSSMLNEFSNLSIKIQSYLSNGTTTANTPSPWATSGGTGGSGGWYRRHLRGNGGQIADRRKFQADIDTKQAQIDGAITQGSLSGLLNRNETDNLRAELNRIHSQEATLTADGRLSFNDARTLTDSLDALNNRVTKQLSDNQFRYRRGGRGATANAAIDARQSFLRQRIMQGITDGRLTRQEADRLLSRENQINDLQTRLTLSGARLNFNEQKSLLNQLSSLSTALNKELNDRQVR